MAGNKRKTIASRGAAPPVPDATNAHDADGEDISLPIVGIGASAGGLEAFQQLFRALPADSGAGFVVIQHLAPDHASQLAEILSRATRMPVVEVHHEALVKANRVYVIPPDRDMTIVGGALQLQPRKNERGVHRPIDQFFRSLAADRRQKAIGVILSGTGNDGALGLEEIKAEGGITFAQDATAQHDGMPRSAIASGCVDLVLPPDAIAHEIARVIRHPYVGPERTQASDSSDAAIAAILQTLRGGTGVDFAGYKTTTLHRRITRRMVLQKMKDLKDYARLLAKSPTEVQALYQDILISVTSFFRNPDLFESLRSKVLPRLAQGRSGNDPIRVWVLGCSTGEEAYSLAMTYAEFAEEGGSRVPPLQIFATDLNARSIENARAGIYAKTIDQDVSPERLRLFFSEVDGHYRIAKSIRDTVVFARHNLMADPPFSHMDLISCRNLLIYLDPDLQKRVLPLLHYALDPDGALILGSSETIGSFRDLFEVDDAKQRIFRRKVGASRPAIAFGGQRPQSRADSSSTPRTREASGEAGMEKQVEQMLLARYVPPAVLIDADMNIVQIRGDTGPYLAPAPGKASLNLLKMAREGLMTDLSAAIQKAKTEETTVRREGLRVRSNGGYRDVSLEVVPIQGTSKGGGFLVVFEEPRPATPAPSERKAAGREGAPATRAKRGASRESTEAANDRLRQELAGTREHLQSVVEEQEAANEELQSANEEAQSANEELQSVNEELETSKEEIESSNEELATVNQELANRNQELSQLTNDLVNLIASVRAPIIMLGRDLRIRRFTPMAEKTLNLIPSDVGRRITDIKLGLSTPDLESMLAEVVSYVTPKEIEVQDGKGCWYLLRILPYKTLDNRIDGAVLMLVDVDALKRAQHYAESVVATVREPLVILDNDLRVVSASGAFYTTFQIAQKETEGQRFFDLGNRQWNIPALRQLLEEILPRDKFFENFAVEDDFEHLGRKIMLLNGRRLVRAEGESPLILLAIEDATESRQLQRITEVTQGSAPIDDLLGLIARRICESLAVDSCTVLVLADDETTLRARASHGLEKEVETQLVIPVGEGTSGVVAATRAPLVVDDLDGDPAAGTALRKTLRSIMAVPILSGGELRGVLEAGSESRRHFTEREVDLMRFASERIAQALDQEARVEAERKAKEALESEATAKDDFFTALSHELRTPMTSILGWTQLLQHAAPNPELVPRALEQIDRAARTLTRLIDDMFDVSRLLVGELSVRFEPVELRSAVEDSVKAVEPIAAQRGILIETKLDAANISGDPVRLRQVFGNLLANAIKFSPANARIQVLGERDGNRASVSVIDEGKGISAEFLPQLFRRFSQEEKGEYGGLGLGLSIAHHLVERHGGTIEAESEGQGKGATLRVTLPLLPD